MSNENSGAGALSINPATGAVIGRHPFHSAEDCDRILARAAQSQARWAASPSAQRAAAIGRIGETLRQKRESLAALITSEMGKPISAARAEVEKCAQLCLWYAANEEKLLADERIDTAGDGEAVVAFLPLGIVLGVMPWNFPFWQVLRAAIPIMLAGNGFLLKHADNVQGCAAALERVIAEAGVPEDLLAVVNVTRGDLPRIIADTRIAAATVTAGTAAGAAIAADAGRNLKKTVLELGGSDPFIVLADADVDHAAATAVRARFQNAGQVCIAAKRIIVERGIADRFLASFVAGVKALRVGDPAEEATEMGPMARGRLRDELHGQIVASVARGAILVLGGEVPDGPGFYYPPTILCGVTSDMPVYCEETFGPVAAIILVDDADDAIRIANDSDFGLSGALWTRDMARASALVRRIETGAVYVNGMAASDPRVPIGGIKRSGYGRELSHFGLREFCNAQLTWLRD
ncbi:aldehyde dehydrogenase family protein [Sphingomonas sp. Root710]|uniref:aldehyde dehydrogenase family protein n=1 Tax=Sphingomonas sp. Root710 TaxID=1736594 RepID=UPI000B1AE934|nr:aldehyde dehydrogenase family protein [Sphingomonas sp. Root710]